MESSFESVKKLSLRKDTLDLGSLTRLVGDLRINPFNLPKWLELGREYGRRGDHEGGEVCFLAAMYLFEETPSEIMRAYLKCYLSSRLDRESGDSEEAQIKAHVKSLNETMPEFIAAIRGNKERLKSELITCLNALEVDQGVI